MDHARRLLLRDGEPVRVGSRALDLLIALVDRAGDVVGKHELLDVVWKGVVVDEAAVRVHLASLRRALGDGRDGARYIVNIPGRGYSFVAPIARDEPKAHPPQAEPPVARSIGPVPAPSRAPIGRDHVIGSLSELLLTRRFVSVVGAGGIGKTTVAAAIAQRLRSEFGDDNVVFVDFGAVSEPELVLGAITSAVGCAVGGADPFAELLTFLDEKRMLIVFDSCEHLVDQTSQLAGKLYQRAPSVHMLITSRESLRVEGETVHLLSPLAYPADEKPTAAEALATPAVQLFMDRAAFSGFHGELTDGDAPVVAEICRRTDGIALAIELAASRVGTYGIHGVASLLAGNMELSLTGRRNVVARHRTLEAMLDWSFNLLAEDERRILCRLSVFVGLFTMEAACSVAGDGEQDAAVAATLASLVDKSLVWVQPEGEGVFYRLPDMTRAYARGRLDESDTSGSIADRHARYFAALFKAIALEHGAYTDIGRYVPHIGNVRKALEWSFSSDDRHAIGVELAADSAPLFLGLWLLTESSHWARRALEVAKGVSDLPRREVRLLEALAVSTMHTLGNTQEVRNAIERGLNLSDTEGGGLTQLRLLAGLNLFLTRLGDFDGALAAAKRSGAIAAKSGTPGDRVIAEWILAAAYHMAGDQAAALDHCERGFMLEANVGQLEINLFGYDHHLRAELARARALSLRGAPVAASQLVLEAMDRASRSSLPGDYSMAAAHGIPVLLWSGSVDQSGEHIERLLAHAERHALKSHAAAALVLRGERLLLLGESPAGLETLREALNMLVRERFHMIIPAASRSLAEALAQCGNHGEAAATVDGAISSATKMSQRFYLPDLLRTRGEILLRGPSPDVEAAEAAFRSSIELARDQSATAWELKAAVPLARLLLQQGRDAEAQALLGSIYEAHPEKDGTRELTEAAHILRRAPREPD
ncbi:ATP-binding protein [Chelatococcus asaccharovorans]|uniref:ATP-binding protein n=1 Tax=Chelatococcus asaccharovorans TaxID=28210 RepID=UPI0014747931|nr:winged helix-turn-helix domain-containing protein [Chelatococcus asaccharovorans]MBS7703033.1 winged helix-turn-helix domain-containing protein [Chelatococcus asaccharovorans]